MQDKQQKTKNKALRPILLVPGVCGSKLYAENSNTQEKTTCWLNPSFDAESYVQKYLWTKYDEEKQIEVSRVHQYEDIKAFQGIEGCDYLIDSKLIRNLGKRYESFAFASYYQKMIIQFQKCGYKNDDNLFGFSYDWRISPSDERIQDQFDQTIKHIYNKTNQKVIIIGHSMGGQVTDLYIKKNKESYEMISNFIAISVPFGGSSAYTSAVYTYGYNIQVPISQCTSKGLGTGSSSIVCLQCPQPYKDMTVMTQIFVRKPKQPNVLQIQKNDNLHIYKNIKLNQQIYSQRTPDVCFIIAQEIMKTQHLKTNILYNFVQLQNCCIPGSISIYNKTNTEQKDINDVFEKQCNDNNIDELNKMHLIQNDQWEIYQSFNEQIKFKYKNNTFCEVSGNKLKYSDEFEQLLYKQCDLQQSTFYNLLDFLNTKQFFYQQSSQCTNILNKEFNCVGPWQFPLQHIQLNQQVQSLHQLYEKMHPDGTLERHMYNYSKNMENKVLNQLKCDEIDTDTFKQGFRFLNIAGHGRMTPLHMVYYQNVETYYDFLNEKPLYIMADGDGTVLSTCAMADGYPERLVDDRILLYNCEHFTIVRDDRLIKCVMDYLGLQPLK